MFGRFQIVQNPAVLNRCHRDDAPFAVNRVDSLIDAQIPHGHKVLAVNRPIQVIVSDARQFLLPLELQAHNVVAAACFVAE